MDPKLTPAVDILVKHFEFHSKEVALWIESHDIADSYVIDIDSSVLATSLAVRLYQHGIFLFAIDPLICDV